MVDLLLYLSDDAFDGVITSPTDGVHSVMSNLASVGEAEWSAVPGGGDRSIADIVEHLAFAKKMYTEFGLQSTDEVSIGEPVSAERTTASMREAIEGLKLAHQRWRERLARLSDDDLPVRRRTHWGETKAIQWFITTMIEHDLYHAGEINHLRSLLQRRDSWGLLPGLPER